jgi:hypothetical protein
MSFKEKYLIGLEELVSLHRDLAQINQELDDRKKEIEKLKSQLSSASSTRAIKTPLKNPEKKSKEDDPKVSTYLATPPTGTDLST